MAAQSFAMAREDASDAILLAALAPPMPATCTGLRMGGHREVCDVVFLCRESDVNGHLLLFVALE